MSILQITTTNALTILGASTESICTKEADEHCDSTDMTFNEMILSDQFCEYIS